MTAASSNGYPPEEKALNAALAAAQGEFPPIPREKTVQVRTRDGASFTYSYAPLDVVLAAVRPVLAKHGLALIQRLESYPGAGEMIRTELRHAEGGVIAASFPLGERPQSPQQLGSLLTYLRRYTIQAMLGIAPEDDDDGQHASDAKPAARASTPKVPKPTAKADPRPEPPEPLDAGEVVLTFGKYKGKTIAEVAAEDRRYIGWVAHESSNEKIKDAAVTFLHDDDIPF